MSVDCTDWQEQIWLWLEGELEDAETDDLQAHLKVCSQCRHEVIRQRQLTQILTSSPMVEPASGFSIRFQDRLEARRFRARTWLGMGVLTLVAASALVVLATTLMASGASWWQTLPLQSLLKMGVTASITLGESAATVIRLALLISKALGRGLHQPIFAIYAIFTALMTMVWIFVVSNRSSRLAPVTADVR